MNMRQDATEREEKGIEGIRRVVYYVSSIDFF